MGKIAFVFSGQGAQKVGMGKDLYDNNGCAKAVFDRAEVIREGTLFQCFEGEDAVLNETKNTQPCMFTMEMAVASALEKAGVKADMVAGFSLGELSALCYGQIADFDTMLKLVIKRGELMQKEAERVETAMVAVLKLDAQKVVEISRNFEEVYPVNFNCPGQVSVSGRADSLAEFSAAIKEIGGRVMPLKVKGGFHSPFMNEASGGFRAELEKVDFNKMSLPVYSNCTGEVYGEDVVDTLSKQICNPVQWEKTIDNMIKEGVDTFIEIGPADVLCGMIKRISTDVRLYAVNNCESLEKVVMEVGQC